MSSTADERKRKRMVSNRESARRSRMRKQKLIGDLVQEKAALEGSIAEAERELSATWRRYSALEAENGILRAEKERLAEYAARLHEILARCGEIEVRDGGIPIPDVSAGEVGFDQNPWSGYFGIRIGGSARLATGCF